MNQDHLPTKVSDKLPVQQTSGFEYSFLEAQTRLAVQQHTNEIKTLMHRNAQDIINIGQKLIEVKQHLGHGNFRNWLRYEFNWSISTATKFMQVGQQFKCVDLAHLNITASSLYLIAAPSTPQQARIEVLERASNGENIGYSKAKLIVCQHRRTKKAAVELKAVSSVKPDESLNVIEPTSYGTTSVISTKEDVVSKQEDLTEKQAQTETLPTVPSGDKVTGAVTKCILDDTAKAASTTENQVPTSHNTPDTGINQMAINIKNLTPEQLARVIIEAANNGLSEYHLSAVITASQRALSVILHARSSLHNL